MSSIKDRALFVFDDPEHRGVGVVAQEFGALGYKTMSLADFTLESLQGVDLLMTISIPFNKLGPFLEGLNKSNPDRDYKVVMIFPERNIPKSEKLFLESLDRECFDGIAHVSTSNLDHWKERFPEKIHGYFQNPSTLQASEPKTSSDLSVISSGVFASFKGLGVLLKGSSDLMDFPELTFSYTGCQFKLSKKSGKITGSPELVTSLATDLKDKELRENIVIHPSDDWSAREPGGKLNVFPSYSDRAKNSQRIADSGVYLFTPCAILDETSLKSHVRRGHLLRWASAVDYNLLEAMASGTPCLISHGYHARLLARLEAYGKNKLGLDLVWPVPLYDTLKEAGAAALEIIKSPDYAEISKKQIEYFNALRDIQNQMLEESLEVFLGNAVDGYESIEIPRGTEFGFKAQMTLPIAS